MNKYYFEQIVLTPHHKDLFIKIIASPFFLAIPIAIAIILLLPIPFSKYLVTPTKKKITDKPNSYISFDDLNGDGYDEEVIAFHNEINGHAAVKVLTKNGTNYDQWNFPGYFQKPPPYWFYIADLNNDKFKEIYVFYNMNDSLFMAAFQPYPDKKTLFAKKFITNFNIRNGKSDYRISCVKTADFNNDNFDELVFNVLGGYCRQPRMLVVYDYKNDSLFFSTTTGIWIINFEIADMDKDGFPEIYCGSSTPGNIPDRFNIPYDDYHSYLTGYNNHLKPLFPPVTLGSYPSSSKIQSFKNNSFLVNKISLGGQHKYRYAFYQYPPEEYSKIEFDCNDYDTFYDVIVKKNGKDYMLFAQKGDNFFLLNEDLNIIKSKTLKEQLMFILKDDMNKDGKEEYLFRKHLSYEFVIFDSDLEHPATFVPFDNVTFKRHIDAGIKHNGNTRDELFFKTDDIVYFFNYKENKYYLLRYPIYLIIYLLVAFMLWGTQQLNHIQVKRKQQMEETIASLRIKTIKSQLDPHFMFNVLNGLAHNITIGNIEYANKQIIIFSKLLRTLINAVEKIDITLKEELEFVNRYLLLEKFRFKEDFEFEINIESGVNQDLLIPRMIIQLLVENAMKHGLRHKKGFKKVLIDIKKQANNKTVIVVEDNGIGRKAAAAKEHGLGKGTRLLTNLIELNKRIKGTDIEVKYEDLYDENNTALGTRVYLIVMG